MKRSSASGLLVLALVTALVGCSEPEPVAAPAPITLAERHESVALATTTRPTTPAPTPTPSTPSVHETAHETVREPAPAPRTSAPLWLRRLVVSTGIDAREPVGASDVIAAGEERVYAFLEVQNRGDDETLIVTFVRDDDDRVVGDVSISIPAETQRWRTWAFTRHLTPGAWHAVVTTEDGDLVGEHAFEVR